nr:CFE protein [Tanacetum cinerariifolium]
MTLLTITLFNQALNLSSIAAESVTGPAKLRPFYVFVIINTLIITIAATLCFYHHTNHNEVQSQPLDHLPPVTVLPMIVYEDVNTLSEVSAVVYEVENPIIDDEPVVVDDKEVLVVNEAEDIHEVTRSTWQSPMEKVQTEFVFPVREKPLAGSRFFGQRKLAAKVNPEGDKPHSFFAPEGKPPRRGLNPRPLACGNNLPKVTLGCHLS